MHIDVLQIVLSVVVFNLIISLIMVRILFVRLLHCRDKLYKQLIDLISKLIWVWGVYWDSASTPKEFFKVLIDLFFYDR